MSDLLPADEQNPMPPLARVLVRASTFRGFGRLANAEQKFVVVLADEVQRLTRELKIQKAVVDLAYIPHRSLVESRDRADAEIARLRPMAESWESYEAAQECKAEMRLAVETSNSDQLGEQLYLLLVRRGYAQHEAHAIASGPGCTHDCVKNGYQNVDCPAHGKRAQETSPVEVKS